MNQPLLFFLKGGRHLDMKKTSYISPEHLTGFADCVRLVVCFLSARRNPLRLSRDTKIVEIMVPKHSSKGILLFFLMIGLTLDNTDAGIGLKPLDFFRFNEEVLGREFKVIFHPEEGLRLRESFQKKYGTRGEELIKSLGEGLVFAANNIKPES